MDEVPHQIFRNLPVDEEPVIQVKEQNLPWINVCDSQGANSKYIGQYNSTKLPTSYFISHGELVDAKVTDEKSLDELLGKLLK